MQAIRKFDNYVVPANFFGVGHLSAYNPTTSQQEDQQNVIFDTDQIGKEFHGFISKKRLR